MKCRIYLRVAKTNKGFRVDASKKPNYEPLKNSHYRPTYHPTVLFALDVDIPNKEFDAARILLKAKIEESTPAVEIKQITEAEA